MPQDYMGAYRIGVTGTIASGKSLVGRCLETLGIPVLDTDAVVAQLYKRDEALIVSLTERFGPQIQGAEGGVYRPALRDIVFNDAQALADLNALVHPRVREVTRTFLTEARPDGAIRVVLIPLLFEAQSESLYDETWCVTVQPESRLIERLMRRETGLDADGARARLSKQWSQAEKAIRATRCIDNSGTPEDTCREVTRMIAGLKEAFHHE